MAGVYGNVVRMLSLHEYDVFEIRTSVYEIRSIKKKKTIDIYDIIFI